MWDSRFRIVGGFPLGTQITTFSPLESTNEGAGGRAHCLGKVAMFSAFLRRRDALTVAAIVAFSVSCTSEGNGTKGEPPVLEIHSVLTAKDIVLPLDAYWPTDQQNSDSFRAVYIVGEQCMKRFGSRDWPAPALGPQQKIDQRNARRYGVFVESEVARFGYKPPVDSNSQGTASPPPQTRTPTDLENKVWAGEIKETPDGKKVPVGGCSQEAEMILSKGKAPVEYRDFVQKLSLEANSDALKDSRAQQVNSRWSECMARSGYRYRDIWEPNKTFGGERASNEELSTALADVGCRKETNLTGTLLAIESAYQKRAIEENSEALEKIKDYQDAIDREVSRVLTESRY
ncbi:hypothetical protein [Streptomyces sp. SID3343]|uniref:hypothetical protein n=1 Tax=Streptomyces sp. SID3343 TaxID=2690260 RepID=UPI00136E92B3|nr:hypothetical protein [Streptomyces sp. SID3343]MYW05633.1 hypothetical protein [Streptomyces sp. SID3343]